jgi:hypothetical protein
MKIRSNCYQNTVVTKLFMELMIWKIFLVVKNSSCIYCLFITLVIGMHEGNVSVMLISILCRQCIDIWVKNLAKGGPYYIVRTYLYKVFLTSDFVTHYVVYWLRVDGVLYVYVSLLMSWTFNYIKLLHVWMELSDMHSRVSQSCFKNFVWTYSEYM